MATVELSQQTQEGSPPFAVRRFSVDEYHAIGAAGVLSPDDRVELLRGWIVPQIIHNPRHDATVDLISESLRDRLPTGCRPTGG